MEARSIDVRDRVPASKKLQADDARALLGDASKLIVAKGKKVTEFSAKTVTDEAVSAMLGPTGNLRAPTLRIGKTLLVGFNDEVYSGLFG